MLTRCQRRMQRRHNLITALQYDFGALTELSDIYWEQHEKTNDPITKREIKRYARQIARQRQHTMKALRSRNVTPRLVVFECGVSR